MPKSSPDDRTPAANTFFGSSLERAAPTDGVRLPDRFTAKELESAWVRANQPYERLFALPKETREELRHPFTLRVYLDLVAQGDGPPQQTRRTDLLRAWLDRRLDVEIRPTERLSRQQLEQSLIAIAAKLIEARGGSLCVDELSGVPRFNPTHPPGPVVERLLAANILESVPGRRDHIRFAVEAVQDFYRAEAEMEVINGAPVHAAEEFAKISFTEAYPRLARISQMLQVRDESHQEFVACLAAADPRKGAVVMRCDPSQYPPSLREAVLDALGQQITARHRVRGALAIHLLSDLRCEEADRCLVSNLLPPAQPHGYLKNVAVEAFIRLGLIAGIELVYSWPWFGGAAPGQAYYFEEMLGMVRSATPDFKAALAERAIEQLQAVSGHLDHARAVCVLAYLGDKRLASHLSDRLNDNGSLLEYENHALIALGTDAAGEVFYWSARGVAGKIAELSEGDVGRARFELHLRISPRSADLPYLYTPQFEPHIARLICDDDMEVAYLGYDLAQSSKRPSLVYDAIRALVRWEWAMLSKTDRP